MGLTQEQRQRCLHCPHHCLRLAAANSTQVLAVCKYAAQFIDEMKHCPKEWKQRAYVQI